MIFNQDYEIFFKKLSNFILYSCYICVGVFCAQEISLERPKYEPYILYKVKEKKRMKKQKKIMAFFMSLVMMFLVLGTGNSLEGRSVQAEEVIATDTDAGIDGDVTTESSAEDVVAQDVTFDNNAYVGENYQVTFTLDSYWDSGYNATITIANTGDSVIENWTMAFPLGQNISNIWNATIAEVHEDYFVIKNDGWNQDIAVGGSVSFGITCYEAFTEYPAYYTLLGNEVELADGDYSVAYEITEDWGFGYKAQLTITNNKDTALEDWRIKFNYGDNLITQIWDGMIISDDNGQYLIGCQLYNQNIAPGASVTFGFLVEPGTSDAEISDIVMSEYNTSEGGGTSGEDTGEDGDASGEGTDEGGEDTSGDNIDEDREDDEKDEIDLDDVFVGLLGGINEEKKELELHMFSNMECIKYDIYVSYDGIEYTLYDTTEDDSYIFSLNEYKPYINFYVNGYYDEETYVESPWLNVSGNYNIAMENSDSDGVEDSYEFYYGSDINIEDTDADGLNDFYEIYISFTNPSLIDTDNNGILDGQEDYDKDGLTTKQEANNNADSWNPDTDDDGLWDGKEVNLYHTKVRVADTDNDGLNDGDEIILGTDPRVKDTDGDGISDGRETYEQNYTYKVENETCSIDEISISTSSKDCVQSKTVIESVMNKDYHSSRVVGLYGEPFEIETTAKFDIATLSFKVDKDSLGDIPFENLMFLWYDEIGMQFVELETIHDEETGIVSTETTHFSKYMLVDKEKWYKAWSSVLDYDGADGTNHINTVLCIDCSDSMNENDPIFTNKDVNSADEAKYRKTCGRINGACNYIDMMTADDNSATVFFNEDVFFESDFTNDKQELKLYMQEIISSGETNFDASMQKSIDKFTDEMLNDPNACNRVVFISDGNGMCSEEILNLYVEKGVKLYTIKVGGGLADDKLKAMALATGGCYFNAYEPEDLSSIYYKIYVQRTFEVTDDDEDGLYDEVETIGIRLIDGTVIYTDPNDDDSDDDGLLDGEEIDTNPILYTKIGMNEDGELGAEVRGYMFIMYSDPNNPDTDGDGALDYEDATPKSYNKSKSYIFTSSTAEDFMQHEADTRYLELKYVYDKNVQHITTNSISDFVTSWNKMGLNSNGKKEYIIDEVHLIYHGNPCSIAIAENGWLYADDNTYNDEHLNNKFNKKRDISVDNLEPKSIQYLNLSSCNNGNLDFTFEREDFGYNMAIAFLKSNNKINKITAWDGVSVYYGVYCTFYEYDYVISYEYSHTSDEFDAWSREVNGWERKAEQQVTYWIDGYGNIVCDKEKHKIN
ncbi:MAG: VWA domain-containing protein [Lachnospiraceae bacterium]|nr:VWA domain-containing protein [Lachnospiraceae bacterium]